MKKFFKFQVLALALLTVFFVSCDDDNDSSPEYPSLKGAFLVNQGDFGKNNGAVSFYSEDGITVDKDIFNSVNGRSLGDVVQDFEVVDTLGFIVVNNSQKVEVVRMRDFKSVTTIEDDALTYPRYVAQATESTVYISNGSMAGEVIVYDFMQNTVLGNIEVGKGPEMMVKVGNKMYVANSGGWDVDNTISVIDIAQGKVIKTITADDGSVTMKLDSNDNVWLYSKGVSVNWTNSAAKLFMINTKTDEIEKTFDLIGTIATYGNNLLAISSEGDLYYTVDGLYKMNINDDELPTTKWSDIVYFGIDVDPETGAVYGMDATNKKVEILNSEDASVMQTLSDTYAFPSIMFFNK